MLAGTTGVDRKLNLIGGFSGHRTAIIAQTDAVIDVPASVDVLRVTGHAGRPDLAAALLALAHKGIQSLLIEPGPPLPRHSSTPNWSTLSRSSRPPLQPMAPLPLMTASSPTSSMRQVWSPRRRRPSPATPSPSIGGLHSPYQPWCIDVLGRGDYGDVLPGITSPEPTE